MAERLQIPKQLRAATLLPGSIDEKRRTVDLVWSTGAAVTRFDFWTGRAWIEELSMEPTHVRMDRLKSGNTPLIDSHNTWGLRGVIGIIETASIEGAEGKARVRFSERADVEPIWKDVQDGIIRNVSVGYIVHRFKDVSGDEAKVKRLRAVDWEPTEVSLVPVPADAGAGIRAGEQMFVCEIEELADAGAASKAGQRSTPLDVAMALNDHRRKFYVKEHTANE